MPSGLSKTSCCAVELCASKTLVFASNPWYAPGARPVLTATCSEVLAWYAGSWPGADPGAFPFAPPRARVSAADTRWVRPSTFPYCDTAAANTARTDDHDGSGSAHDTPDAVEAQNPTVNAHSANTARRRSTRRRTPTPPHPSDHPQLPNEDLQVYTASVQNTDAKLYPSVTSDNMSSTYQLERARITPWHRTRGDTRPMTDKTRRTSVPGSKQGKIRRAQTPPARCRALLPRAAIATLALGAIASLAIYLALPDNHRPTPPKPASTVADNKNACLLADANQPQTPSAFADLQQAAATLGGINVRQTTLPTKVEDAAPELAGLIQQHCDVIYTVGPLSTAAVKAATATSQPNGLAFVAITDDAVSGTRLTKLSAAHLSASQIAASLAGALH